MEFYVGQKAQDIVFHADCMELHAEYSMECPLEHDVFQ